MGVGLVCTGNHCCIHLKLVSFSSGYLYKQGQLPFFISSGHTVLGFAESLHLVKQKSSNQALLIDYCARGHKIIISHLICQIRNALHFLDFASWCIDTAIPSILYVAKYNIHILH